MALNPSLYWLRVIFLAFDAKVAGIRLPELSERVDDCHVVVRIRRRRSGCFLNHPGSGLYRLRRHATNMKPIRFLLLATLPCWCNVRGDNGERIVIIEQIWPVGSLTVIDWPESCQPLETATSSCWRRQVGCNARSPRQPNPSFREYDSIIHPVGRIIFCAIVFVIF